MATLKQKVKFGGTELATQFFDPRRGPREYQTMRWQPFGLKGMLELRGEQGGQPLFVPVRLFASSYDLIRKAIDKVEAQVGKREKLTLTYNAANAGAGTDQVGEVTFDAAIETLPPRYIVWDSGEEKAGWEAVLLLTFFSLVPKE